MRSYSFLLLLSFPPQEAGGAPATTQFLHQKEADVNGDNHQIQQEPAVQIPRSAALIFSQKKMEDDFVSQIPIEKGEITSNTCWFHWFMMAAGSGFISLVFHSGWGGS